MNAHRFPLLLLLAGSCAALGCAPAVHQPHAGLAGLRVHVVAEPKYGTPEAQGDTYDDPPDRGPGGVPHDPVVYQRLDYAHVQDVVVWAEPTGAAATAADATTPPADMEVDVNGTPSAPGATRVATVGQLIVFRNRGPRPQTVYGVSDGNDFDLGTLPPGGSASYRVRAAGPIEVLTDAARDPAAVIYAAPTRWAAPARANENVDFDNLPPGPYRVVSWHPRLPGEATDVTLSPDHVAQVTLKVGVNSLPKVTTR